MVEQNFDLFHNFCDYKTNYLKTVPQIFQKSYTSFHVPRPSTPFNFGIPSALNRRPMYNLSATFVGDKEKVGGLWLEWKVTLSFPKYSFCRMHETLWWSIVVKYTFQKDNFCRCLRSVFILSCYLSLFDDFEGQLSLSNINRTSTYNFPVKNLTLIKRYTPFVFLYCSL